MLSLLVALAVTPPNPHALVDSAIVAMQRSASLRQLRSLRLSGMQHDYLLGNAERAEGPWRVLYSQFTELRDPRTGSSRRADQTIAPTGIKNPERITVFTDTVVAVRTASRENGSSHAAYEDIVDRIDGSPERALLLAAAAPDLRLDGSVSRYGITFDVVSHPWRNGRMTIELNRDTHLPDAVEIVRAYPDNFRWDTFGSVAMRIDYVDWTVLKSGSYWPMQAKVSFNGQPLGDVTLAAFGLDTIAG